jgi:hypothetical protein
VWGLDGQSGEEGGGGVEVEEDTYSKQAPEKRLIDLRLSLFMCVWCVCVCVWCVCVCVCHNVSVCVCARAGGRKRLIRCRGSRII